MGVLKQFVRMIRNQLGVLLQLAVWLSAVVTAFLRPPPATIDGEGNDISRLGVFVVAVLIGLVFVLARQSGAHRALRLWVPATIVLLAAGIGTWFLYQHMWETRTAAYPGGRCITGVEGDTTSYTAKARSVMYKGHGALKTLKTPQELVFQFGGVPTDIWSPAALERSRRMLNLTFLMGLAVISMCGIALVQAVSCSSAGEQGRRRTAP